MCQLGFTITGDVAIFEAEDRSNLKRSVQETLTCFEPLCLVTLRHVIRRPKGPRCDCRTTQLAAEQCPTGWSPDVAASPLDRSMWSPSSPSLTRRVPRRMPRQSWYISAPLGWTHHSSSVPINLPPNKRFAQLALTSRVPMDPYDLLTHHLLALTNSEPSPTPDPTIFESSRSIWTPLSGRSRAGVRNCLECDRQR